MSRNSFKDIASGNYPWLNNMGIVTSVIFAVWALLLTLTNNEMADAIREMKESNKKLAGLAENSTTAIEQNSNTIAKLANLVENSQTTITQNSQQIRQNGDQLAKQDEVLIKLREQVDIFTLITGPRVGGNNIYGVRKHGPTEAQYLFGFTNHGIRTAENVRVQMSFYSVRNSVAKKLRWAQEEDMGPHTMESTETLAYRAAVELEEPVTQTRIENIIVKVDISFTDQQTKKFIRNPTLYLQYLVHPNLMFIQADIPPKIERQAIIDLENKLKEKKEK